MTSIPSDSQEELEKLERKHAENPEGRYFVPLANLYRRNGDIDRAMSLLRDGLAEHPDYLSAHIVLGRCLADRGETAAAEAEFRYVLSLDSQNLIALRTLGEIATELGRVDEGRKWYRELLDVDPMNEEARQALQGQPEAQDAAAVAGGTQVRIADAEMELAGRQASEAPPAAEPPPPDDEQSLFGTMIDLGTAEDAGHEPAAPLEGDEEGNALVTETIAELYTRQGFYDRARDVYLELIRRRGDDERLHAQLRKVEELAAGTVEQVETPAEVSREEDPQPEAELGRDDEPPPESDSAPAPPLYEGLSDTGMEDSETIRFNYRDLQEWQQRGLGGPSPEAAEVPEEPDGYEDAERLNAASPAQPLDLPESPDLEAAELPETAGAEHAESDFDRLPELEAYQRPETEAAEAPGAAGYEPAGSPQGGEPELREEPGVEGAERSPDAFADSFSDGFPDEDQGAESPVLPSEEPMLAEDTSPEHAWTAVEPAAEPLYETEADGEGAERVESAASEAPERKSIRGVLGDVLSWEPGQPHDVGGDQVEAEVELESSAFEGRDEVEPVDQITPVSGFESSVEFQADDWSISQEDEPSFEESEDAAKEVTAEYPWQVADQDEPIGESISEAEPEAAMEEPDSAAEAPGVAPALEEDELFPWELPASDTSATPETEVSGAETEPPPSETPTQTEAPEVAQPGPELPSTPAASQAFQPSDVAASEPTPETESGEEDDDDLESFQAWLRSLKR